MPFFHRKRFSLLLFPIAVCFAALLAAGGKSAGAPLPRTLDDYRHFRITAIDLAGRMPTRDEVAAFERPDFDFDKWVDEQLAGPGYVERMTRIYMDLLRLEPNLNFSSGPAQLFRQEIQGPDGKPVFVFYRNGQRREREATDGEFCLSPDETGIVVRPGAKEVGTPKKVSKQLLDKYTTLVKPWWLYRDYLSVNPSQRLGQGWNDADPDYKLADGLLTDPDGQPILEVRVCREEALTGKTGHVYASGRVKPPDAKPPGGKVPGVKPKREKYRVKLVDGHLPETMFAGGRIKPAPFDRPYATKHKGEPIACGSRAALDFAPDCGCGIGLEQCIPNDGPNQGSAFFFPNHMPLGPELPLDSVKQQAQRWFPYWWSREAVHFLDDLFASDRDFRQILTGHQTFVNGPLAQFYKTIQRGNCCGPEIAFGMTEETEPLFDPKNVPADLAPADVGNWELVADRGPHAAGVLTLPMFLEKYASARARGAALYNAFLCKSFLADNKTQLTPSTEPNLMIRPGCASCHATLEPLAAYFARVEPGSFVFLPESSFPTHSTTCKKDKNGKMNGPCTNLYDLAFADDKGAMLRSAYGSLAHADATPAGAAEDITRSPEFAACAVQRVASSFLGRPTNADDEPLLRSLDDEFVKSGYRMRALVRALVHSPAYGRSNNVSSGAVDPTPLGLRPAGTAGGT
ncbi:MAG: DUF1585 domain-containing protein [Polyangiaceae bacterium]